MSNIEKKTPLYLAIEIGNIDVVRILLEKPEIDVNEKSFFSLGKNKPKEQSPLCLSVEKGYNDIADLLMQNKNIDKEQLKMAN